MNQNDPIPAPTRADHPIVDFTFDDLTALLRRTILSTSLLGATIALALCLAMGWQTAGLFAVGAAISVGSIYEWGRLIRLVNQRMDGGRSSGFGTGLVIGLFLVRLILFAGVIYGSLRFLHGSPIALFCGLGLALAGLAWQSMKVLRG
jgi:hypothetical protein